MQKQHSKNHFQKESTALRKENERIQINSCPNFLKNTEMKLFNIFVEEQLQKISNIF